MSFLTCCMAYTCLPSSGYLCALPVPRNSLAAPSPLQCPCIAPCLAHPCPRVPLNPCITSTASPPSPPHHAGCPAQPRPSLAECSGRTALCPRVALQHQSYRALTAPCPCHAKPCSWCSWLSIITSFPFLLSLSLLCPPFSSSRSTWLWLETGDPGRYQLPFFLGIQFLCPQDYL